MMYDDEQDINQQKQPSRVKTIAKDAGKKITRQTGKATRLAMKQVIITIIKLFGAKFFIIAGAILVVIMILVASVKVIKLEDGGREDGNNRKCTICCI